MSAPVDFNDRMLSLGLARVAEQAAIASASLIRSWSVIVLLQCGEGNVQSNQ